MTQILVSTVVESCSMPVDPDKPDGDWETVQSTAIDEVVEIIPNGQTASINGNDIHITPNRIIGGGKVNLDL